MRIGLIAFTRRGEALARRLAAGLCAQGDEAASCAGFGPGHIALKDWTQQGFAQHDALIYVGAVGIAVRAVAPHLRGKLTDPAVLVLDEGGRFCISLLSGHVGGANALCQRVAALAGALPVVTTATDGRGLFAVDTWAAARGLTIANPEGIKRVSSKILEGQTVTVLSDIPLTGTPPQGVVCVQEGEADVVIGLHDGPGALTLVPRCAALGVGCRKGASQADIEAGFVQFMRLHGLHPACIAQVASIDLKANEPGLVGFCAAHGVPLVTFSAEQLRAQGEGFTASAFVSSAVGVDNVCERSAMAASGGRLLARKTICCGVTFALAAQQNPIAWPETDREEEKQ